MEILKGDMVAIPYEVLDSVAGGLGYCDDKAWCWGYAEPYNKNAVDY